MLTRKLKVFSKEWLCPERNAGYLQAMMFRIPSFKVVLLRRESWDCTMRDRASRANESPCQPHLTPYEIHGEPQGIYYPQPGFGLPEYLMTAHPGIDLFPLCFLFPAQCELRRLGIHLLNCSLSLISEYLKMIRWIDAFCARTRGRGITLCRVEPFLTSRI